MNVGKVSIDVKLNTSEVEKGFKKIGESSEKATRTINKQYNKTGKLIKTSITDSWTKAGVKYKQTTTTMIGNNNKLIGSLGKLAKGFSIAYIIVRATKAMMKFASESLVAAQKVQKANNMVNTVYSGENKSLVNKKAQSAITESSLTQTEYKHYAALYGSMANNLGFGEDVSTMMATNLTDLQGNIAMFYDLTAEEAYTKAKAVFTGETESIKELGIRFTDRALTEYSQAIYGKSYSDMSEIERATTRYEYFMQQMSQYSTSFKDMSNTWAGQVKIFQSLSQSIKDNFGQALASVLYPLLVMINKALEQLNNWLDKIAKKFTQLSGQALNVKSGVLDDNVSSEDSSISTGSGSGSKNNLTVLGFDKLNKLNDKSIGSGISSIDLNTANTVKELQGLKHLAEMNNEEQEAVVQTVKDALDRNTGLQLDIGAQTVKDVFKGIGETYLMPFSAVKDSAKALRETFDQMVNRIKSGDGILAWSKALTQDLPENLRKNWNSSIDEMIERTKMNTSSFTKGITDSFIALNYGAAQLLNGIKLIFGTAIEAIADILKAVLDGPGGYSLTDAWDDISEYATNAVKAFGEQNAITIAQLEQNEANFRNAQAEQERIVNERRLENFSQTAQELIETDGLIQDEAIALAMTASETTDAIILQNQAYLKNLSTTNSYVLDYIDSIKNKFVSSVQEVASTLNSTIRTLTPTVSGLANGAGVISSGSGSRYNQTIRKYATGGYVRANSPQLAIVGDNTREGEIIAPESKITEAVIAGLGPLINAITNMNTGGGYSGPQQISVSIGEREFNDAVVSAINNRSLRTGGI